MPEVKSPDDQVSRYQLAPGTAGVMRPSASAAPAQRPLFRQEVLDYQQNSRQWGRVVPLLPLSTRILVWMVFVVAGAIIAFLFLAHYARKEVASGYLTPAAGTARVFASQPGTISAVFVEQGQKVEKGQKLLAIDTGQISSSGADVNETILKTVTQQKLDLTRQIATEESRTESERERLKQQITEHENALIQLEAQMAVQRDRIKLVEKVAAIGADLRSRGLVSDLDQKHREDTLLNYKQSLMTLVEQVTARQGQLREVRFNLEQLPFTQSEKVQALRNELAAAEQRAAEVGGRRAYIVQAPISGRISSLQASVGRPAEPSRLQLEIVPGESPLQAEIFIPARAIGFVEVGQDVRLLYDAFPYQRFGTYHGRIVKVSQTALTASDVSTPFAPKEPSFRATVTLDRADIDAYGKKIALQPDMSLRADIILERRTLVEWILNPLLSARIQG